MKISDIVALGLWPDSKKTTSQKGISELEDLGKDVQKAVKKAPAKSMKEKKAEKVAKKSSK